MRRTLRGVFAIVVFFFLPLRSQEPGLPAADGKAIVFSFSGLNALNLNQFEGGVGGKYAMTDVVLIRAGLQFAIAEQDLPANPPAGQTGTDGSRSATMFGVSGALEYHLTRTRVSPFLGGGVGISFTSTEEKDAVAGTTAQTTTKNDVNGEVIDGVAYLGGTAFSVFGMAGLEYFLTNNVSLAAEYRLGYTLTSRSDEEATSGNTTITTKVGSSTLLGFSTGGALALAVYF